MIVMNTIQFMRNHNFLFEITFLYFIYMIIISYILHFKLKTVLLNDYKQSILLQTYNKLNNMFIKG